jgi:hypothetical protein
MTALKMMTKKNLLNLEGEQTYSSNEGPRKQNQNSFSKILLRNQKNLRLSSPQLESL